MVDKPTRAVFYLAIILIALSMAQTFYRLSLPTEGWSFIRDTTGSGERLAFDSSLSGLPSPLRQGDILQAVDGQPYSAILVGALKLKPQRPPNWASGQVVGYTVERHGRLLSLPVRLVILDPRAAVLQAGRNLLLNPGPLLTLLIALFVFFREAAARRDSGRWGASRVSTPANLLLLFSAAVFASDNVSQLVSGTNLLGPAEMFSLGAFWPAQFMNSLIWPFVIAPLFIHLLLAFPVSRVQLRRLRRPALAVMYLLMPALTLVIGFITGWREPEFWRAWNTFSFIDFVLVLLVAIGIMTYTLVTARDPGQRAQATWVAWGTILTSLGALLGMLPLLLGLSGFYLLLAWTATRLLLLGFPVAVAIAILRYRLFDIHIIIHNTLVYGILTGALGAIYFGCVILLQFTFRELTGAQSPLAVAISTLAIAALFVPLRRRVQEIIDQRMYHHKYDAARTIAAFGAAVRDEVDLDQLSAHLVKTIDETMQPKEISLWLRPNRK